MLNISDNKPYLIRIDWNLDTKHPAAEVYVDNRKRLTELIREFPFTRKKISDNRSRNGEKKERLYKCFL